MPDIAIILRMPDAEWTALAQLVKRIDYDTCTRFSAACTTYDGRSEADVMWCAIHMVARQVADAGYAPR